MLLKTAVFAGILLLALAGAASSKNAATYSDPSGDAGSAPDLTEIRVSNDDIHQLTFELTLANRPAFGANDRVVVWLDTDRNEFTGRTEGAGTGADYSINVSGPSDPDATVVLTRWILNTATPMPQVRIHNGYSPNRVLTVSFNQFAMDATGDFNFSVQTFGPLSFDVSPASGMHGYHVIGDRVRPVVRASATSARRGKVAVLRYRIQDDNPTSEVITVTRRGRQLVRLTTRLRPFAQANVRYRWRVPKGIAPGVWRYCVVATDESFNRSAPHCAALRVR